MEVKAKAKYIAVSPEKVRSVASHIYGKKAEDALAYLKFEPRAAKVPLAKLINSTVSSAENKKLDKDRLIVKEIRVDAGPIYKKQKIRARGRADLRKRRTSHILVVLGEEKIERSKNKIDKIAEAKAEAKRRTTKKAG